MIQEHVILVDPNGKDIGTAEKIQAHRDGKLHRAFSIFVFNALDEVLLQKRAETKYHSGGLWTNTCCSHPRPGENHHHAARRRLHEEMGFDCELQELFSFTYHVKLNDDLFEHELDRVFVGRYEGQPTPNPNEVADWKWMNIDILKQDIQENPQHYTYWFKLVLDRVIKHLHKAPLHGFRLRVS